MIGNKVAEKDIREFLSSHGYYGRSAEFNELELHAIGRPGWLQIFRFCVRAKSIDDEWTTLYGAMKDDERFKLNEIELFANINKRDHLLAVWSSGLTQPRFAGGQVETNRFQYFWELLIFSIVIATLIVILSLFDVQ